MNDSGQMDFFRIIGMIVVALIAFWLVSILLFPIFGFLFAILLCIAGFLAWVLKYVIFLGLLAGIVYGIAYALGMTT